MSYAPSETNRIGESGRQSSFAQALNAAIRVFGELLEARRGRRDIARLVTFDDSMLADIGVARSDVEWALMRPWNDDPSLALAKRVSRRKNSVRWARSFGES